MMRFVTILAITFASTCAFAQQTQPGAVEKLTANVTGVEGIVQVRTAEDQPWQKATVGMQVTENAEFRTGPRSAVRFVIPPDQTITLDRLGTVKVLQAVNDNGKIKTNLGMKYGRTRYDIEAAGREHESVIASPSSTLAVRGTKVSVFDQRPFPAEAVSLTGRAEFRDFRKTARFGNRNAGKTKINVNNPNAAAYALNQAVVDPSIRLARSEPEDMLVATLLGSGATVSFDFEKGIRVIRGGSVPSTDQQLIPTLPGALNFVLRWQGDADLNLSVRHSSDAIPQGETLYPISTLAVSPTGGRIPFDHRGGANGGIEIAFWPNALPGPYDFGSVYISGANPVPATVDVFQDGQRLQFIGPDGSPTTTANYLAGPIPPTIAEGQLAGSLQISSSPSKRPAVSRLRPLAAAPIAGPAKTGKR